MVDRPDCMESWDASWEGTQRQHLEATITATPEQRLAWLEEALQLAYLSGALDEPRAKPK